MGFYTELTKGIWRENPVFRIVLGICPTLAVSTQVSNGIGMGLAATFVIVVELVMQAYAYSLFTKLGIFIPLIVVNCIILGRAEAFASKSTVWMSIADALGMGGGFTVALTIISSIRELLGNGSLLGFQVLPDAFSPAVIMILPPGAFLTIGALLGFFNYLSNRKST